MEKIKTDSAIKALKSKEEKYSVSVDSSSEGLRLVIFPTGRRTFLYRYKTKGKLKKITIGTYPEITLKQAREIHRELVLKRKEGIDPQIDKKLRVQKNLEEPTLEELCSKYYEFKEGKNKSAKETQSMVNIHIISRIGKLKVKDIDTPIIMDTLSGITKDARKKYLKTLKKKVADLTDEEREKYQSTYKTTANRCLTQLKTIFKFAVKRQIVKYSPAAVLDREDAGGTESPRKRYLSFEEIKIFLSKLDDLNMSLPVKLILKVILLTGKRVTETTLTKKQDIDFNNRIWTIPAQNIKATKSNKINKEPDKIYLTDSLIEIFEELITISGSNYIFESPQKEGEPIESRTVNRALDRKIKVLELEKFTVHDLRRTVSTGMSEIGVYPHIVEKVLNHSIKGIEGVYNHSKQWEDKIKAWQDWEEKLNSIMNPEPEPEPEQRKDNIINFPFKKEA